jgi:hypothetical protein
MEPLPVTVDVQLMKTSKVGPPHVQQLMVWVAELWASILHQHVVARSLAQLDGVEWGGLQEAVEVWSRTMC